MPKIKIQTEYDHQSLVSDINMTLIKLNMNSITGKSI